MARERNNIYAVAADAVDLALDTAGTMVSMANSLANRVGVGIPGHETTDAEERQEIDDATERVATSLRQEAEVTKTRGHKTAHKTAKAHKSASKPRATKRAVKTVASKGRTARKAAR